MKDEEPNADQESDTETNTDRSIHILSECGTETNTETNIDLLGDGKFDELESSLHVPLNCYENRPQHYREQHLNSEHILDETDEVVDGDSSSMINISEEDYEGLPSYMKSLVSWEDLQIVFDKINSSIQNKSNTSGRGYFHADELASMGLGPKGRSYLLMLVRMKRLVVETKDGSIFYKVA